MNILLKNGFVFYGTTLQKLDILIVNKKITKIAKEINMKDVNVIDISGLTVLPGLIDVHVHLREPGYENKETIKTGTLAAAAGGFTHVCCMPNTKPVIDNLASLNLVQKIINKDALINVYPYCALTINQQQEKLVDFASLSKKCIAFSDDGKEIVNEDLIKEIAALAKKYKFLTVAHCEEYDTKNSGITNVQQHLEIVSKTNIPYHFCHISTANSVKLIKQAKLINKNITFEVTPHHLMFNRHTITDDGRFVMNPPISCSMNQQAIVSALCDGTVDIVASDHAPHTIKEKAKKQKSLNGVVGLETSFPVMYTNFVRNNKINFKRLIDLMSFNPSRIFKLPKNEIVVGNIANLAIFNLGKKYVVDPYTFKSKGKSTPFAKQLVYGKAVYTICNGEIIYTNID